MRKVFVAKYTTCAVDGNTNGFGRTIGIFDSHWKADAAAVGQGDFGNKGGVEVAYVGDDHLLYKRLSDEIVVMGLAEDPAAVKERALAKLSPEERMALGF